MSVAVAAWSSMTHAGVPRLRPRQVHQDHAGSDSGGCYRRIPDTPQGRWSWRNGGAAGDCTSPCTYAHTRSSDVRATTFSLTAPVTFQEAALGAEIEVPTLGGPSVKLRLSPGTPNGRTLRVRGKGVRKRDGTKGDLLVTVEVLVPQALNEQAREALNSYAEAVGTVNPRAKLFAAG